jgi:hypothetical protein
VAKTDAALTLSDGTVIDLVRLYHLVPGLAAPA